MTKRIVLTGASGVGKTSLAQLLADRLSLPLIPEVARDLCHEMGYRNPTEIPDQQLFRQEVLKRQIATESQVGSFISDRSTVDCWVMWQRWNICSAMTFDTEQYYELCRKQADSYTCVIYIPPMFEAPDDSFRWTEPDYIKQIDRLVRLTLYDWSLEDRMYAVSCEGVDNRLQAVSDWLNKKGLH